MINLLGPAISTDVVIACSGGVDSMAALSFLAHKPYRKITAAFFNHGTDTSNVAEEFLRGFLPKRFPNVKLVVGDIGKATRMPRESMEVYWRNARYAFLRTIPGTVVMAHHLDDCIENWFFTAITGNPRVIPYRNRNVVRPFMLTPKKELIKWCIKQEVLWVEDKTNDDLRHPRNRIRHSILPEIRKVNPGIAKVVAKKVLEAFNEEGIRAEDNC